MYEVFKQFLEMDLEMQLLIIIEHLAFFMYLISVLYLFVFALFSLLRSSAKYPKAQKQYKYAVIFVADEDEDIVVESVKSFLNQDYPKSNYDIIVVSNNMSEQTNSDLSLLPITLLKTDIKGDYKSEALKQSVAKLNGNSYDAVVVMNADNTVDVDFLDKVNNAYYSGGMAIQAHRIKKDVHTNTAVLASVSEEINNSIFRRGHVNLGFSSALIGSGMVFSFDWFSENIQKTISIGIDKQLEAMLIEQSIFIEYLDDVYVYGVSVNNVDKFRKQRSMWSVNRKDNIKLAKNKLPSAIINGNYDYCDKVLQWIIPSRIILFGTLVILTILMTFIYWPFSIKWWVLLIMLMVSFALAIPDALIDARLIKAIKSAPMIFLLTFKNMFKKRG
ncbi:MAG: glycosyltransferase family 2 protein [Rikenellaceae bacterium]